MNGRTREETAAAWQRLLTATLTDTVTSRQVAEIVGISQTTARQWLTRHVGRSDVETGAGGGWVGIWDTTTVRTAVANAQWSGNRSNNRGRGHNPRPAQ